jgi:DNA-binding NtrC family response regulator
MLTIWIIHRDGHHRAALARIAGAGDNTVLGAPSDRVFESAGSPAVVLLGLSADFEQELDFVHRFAGKLRGCSWILLPSAGDMGESKRLFDTLPARYVPYPPSPIVLRRAIRAALQRRRTDSLSSRQDRDQLRGRFGRWFADLEIPELMRAIDPRMARVPILIRGEEGTGRGLLARYIHHFGGNGEEPFIHVSCREVKQMGDLLRQIALAVSDQGSEAWTIWLEDVDTLPIALQRKLEDWIEFGLPDGATRAAKLRWIAGAGDEADLDVDPNLDSRLAEALSGLSIAIPPLRARAGCIEAFVADTTLAWCRAQNERLRRFSPDAIGLLANYPWPGNLHELEAVVMRTLSITGADPLLPAHLRFPTDSAWLEAPADARPREAAMQAEPQRVREEPQRVREEPQRVREVPQQVREEPQRPRARPPAVRAEPRPGQQEPRARSEALERNHLQPLDEELPAAVAGEELLEATLLPDDEALESELEGVLEPLRIPVTRAEDEPLTPPGDEFAEPLIEVPPEAPAAEAAPSASYASSAVGMATQAIPSSMPMDGEPASMEDEGSNLRRLVRAVAHEVRNPLVSIRTFSELLPDHYDDAEFRSHFRELVGNDVRRIDEAVTRLQAMVDLPEVKSEPVDIAHLLESLLDERRDEIQARRLLVLKELDHGLPYALGDPLQLRDAFAGLVDRALRLASDRGDVYIASKHHAAGLAGRPSVRVLMRSSSGPSEGDDAVDEGAEKRGDLDLVLAETVVQAAGGTLTLDTTDAQESVIVIDLPAPSA